MHIVWTLAQQVLAIKTVAHLKALTVEEICHAESCLQSARLTVNCHFAVALHCAPLEIP
jgi:hypothetical protein